MEAKDQTYSLDKFTSQLSAHIWGHRFKDGQRGPEYVLEFLNVLFGSDYSFSQDTYIRRKAVGLRKFVFEGVKEGSVRDVLVLHDHEKQKLLNAVQENNLYVLKQFLRNLEITLYNTTGKEADRSWFARTLYPLHESLLYFELRKKGSELSIERNFFARGGELYFLMLAYGTDNNLERRRFIESRFQELLKRNKVIEKVVNKISSAFEESENTNGLIGRLRSDKKDENIPKLPDPEGNKELFELFSKELEHLLHLDVDIYEMFHLLTSLICFQLTRYMHERAFVSKENEHIYFCDCLEGNNKHITQLSALNFDEHENLIKVKFEYEFERKFKEALGDEEQIERLLPSWRENPNDIIDILGLGQMRTRKDIIIRTLQKCKNAKEVYSKFYSVVKDAVSDQLKKHQLNITRVLTRDGGFATFRRGSAANYRYTISDTFLQMIVFTTVKPEEKMEYYEFLETIYRRYQIVIGEAQAKECGLYSKSNLNVRYFQENEKALRNKLRQNGLLIEFSDATAMIQNPYTSSMEAYSYA
ncbi:hypothetical protein [Paenibacillus sp. OAS669]|uniref:hypothetical protein n=1 Tax=Paenibacillus sp. OAS669 TaxID=2663821 RepID=UPI00178B085C|nr:hypothetical protein [Paenibacillus sp. OAS669]MBE1444855.1 hypothetical protein [Paenibacillus sp. OAS669]